jgi:hypothetical protein
MHYDRELRRAGDTTIIPRASHWNPEGLRLDGPDEHPYTPNALLSEPNCSSSHCARETRLSVTWNAKGPVTGNEIGMNRGVSKKLVPEPGYFANRF